MHIRFSNSLSVIGDAILGTNSVFWIYRGREPTLTTYAKYLVVKSLHGGNSLEISQQNEVILVPTENAIAIYIPA